MLEKSAKVFAALLAAALLAATLTGCAKQLRVSPFLWSNLTWEHNRVSYSDSKYESVTGIDVSEHQGFIDWNAVADDGVSFAFISLGNRGNTEGGLYADDYVDYNLEAARSAGLWVGAYFYSQATTVEEAVEEAQFALSVLDGFALGCPVAFDYEITMGGRIGAVSSETATQCARAFCQVIRDAGYDPALYGNARDLDYYDDSLLDQYPIWFAAYETASPATELPLTYWQYSSTGTVSGIDTDVDMNIWIRKR